MLENERKGASGDTDSEVLFMARVRWETAEIELRQHTDARWMWAFSFQCSSGLSAYVADVKWGKFAVTRLAALDAAVAEGLSQTARFGGERCPAVRAWLQTLRPVQMSLFTPTPEAAP